MKLCRFFDLVICLFLSHGMLLAEESQRTHVVTLDDYFTQVYVTASAIAPDGSKIAYCERRWRGPKESSNIDLWTVDCATKQVQRLTFDAAVDGIPVWSPDSQCIYFISRRKRDSEKSPPWDGNAQAWRCDVATGREIPVTRLADGLDSFRLSADGKQLYYAVSVKHSLDPWKALRDEFSELNYGHGDHQVSEIWKLDLTTWRTERVAEPKRFIHSFDVSPDGSRLVLVTTPDNEAISFEGQSRVDLIDVKSSKLVSVPDDLWRKQAPSPYGWIEEPKWSGSGKHVAFLVQFDGYPAELFVATPGEPAIAVRKLPRPEDCYLVGNLTWRADSDDLYLLGDHHATKAILAVKNVTAAEPVAEQVTHGDFVIDSVSLSHDGERLAVLQSGMDYARDLFLTSLGAVNDRTRLTNLNPQVDTWRLPKVERFKWKGANGVEVEGLLERPADADAGKPSPMIVNIHGGPTGSDYIAFAYSPWGRTNLASLGYAVFYPNYRGSTGYGDSFLTDLIGRENDIEVEDIVKGIDALVDAKVADPDRLGVMGWSNGGYLTNCLITKTERFKAASSGAGMFDMTIQWGEEDTPGHVINYQQGLPWVQAERYQKSSPLYHLKSSFKTATLIHVGEADLRVPPTHSKALHRAIYRYMKDVDVQLVLYPGAGHTPMAYKQRQAKMKWDQAWFEKYLPLH